MYGFDQKLGKAFAEAALAGISMSPPTPLRLEIFLSALSRLFPDEMRPYVEDENRFRFMCEQSWPTTDQVQTQALIASTSSENAPGTAPGFHIQLDPDFERILFLEADTRRSKRPTGLSIRELIEIISRDEQTTLHLKTKWGVALRITS